MIDDLESCAKSMEESNRLKVILYVYIFGAKKETGQGFAAMVALGLDTHTSLEVAARIILQQNYKGLQWTTNSWVMALCIHHSS